ncbi:hypothetical protein CTAM01_06031 [Colletotrichum tamarilloi]|uniref:Uncharacterized protein n=1 Tax=Colletotrichum tamarilloi TaxID=1209934 RepID=A0ABQ9RCT8_9PEZI|nr:uncharacterized protein CTAM01_06031 [Colletotrichum tamarilloi]KAK1501306.1 hypothetical protein CTAM01_06031 [Colletotrichum tamarilloi]
MNAPPYIHNCDDSKGPWTVSKRCSLCIPARHDAGKKPGKSAAINHRLRRATNKLKRRTPPPSHSVCSECGDEGRTTVILTEPDWSPEPEPESESSLSGSAATTTSQRPTDSIGPMNETPADFVYRPLIPGDHKYRHEKPAGVDEWFWSSGSGESYNTRFPPPSLAKRLIYSFCCFCVVSMVAPKPPKLTESERRKKEEEGWNRLQRGKRRSRPWIRMSDWKAIKAAELEERQRANDEAGEAAGLGTIVEGTVTGDECELVRSGVFDSDRRTAQWNIRIHTNGR